MSVWEGGRVPVRLVPGARPRGSSGGISGGILPGGGRGGGKPGRRCPKFYDRRRGSGSGRELRRRARPRCILGLVVLVRHDPFDSRIRVPQCPAPRRPAQGTTPLYRGWCQGAEQRADGPREFAVRRRAPPRGAGARGRGRGPRRERGRPRPPPVGGARCGTREAEGGRPAPAQVAVDLALRRRGCS